MDTPLKTASDSSTPDDSQTQDIFKTDKRKKDRLYEKAETFLEEHKLIYCHDTVQFFLYKDGYYKKCAEETIKKMVMERFPNMTNSARSKTVENLKNLNHFSVDELNQEYVLNFKNGLLDTKTLEFKDHNPSVLSTIRIPYNYDSKAECPLWLDFMKSCHVDSPLNILNLQEFAGYCLTHDTHFEKSLWMIGSGANGKGTFIKAICNVLNMENCSFASLKDLADSCARSVIINKLVNFDSEVNKRAETFENSFCTIVSGETIQISPKFVPQFSYTPYCKLILGMNQMPRIDDLSDGFYRRMMIVPFNVSFKDNPDVLLKKKLEKELPGILNWMIEGLKRLNEHGFTKNSLIETYRDDLKKQNNPILQFVEDCLVLDPKETITKKSAYENYCQWCRENNCKPFSKSKFGKLFFESYKNITKDNFRFSSGSREYAWTGFRYRTEMDNKFEEQVDVKEWEE